MTRDTLPQIGLGTTFDDDDPVVDIIETALDLDYRHVDTAQVYETEDEVGVIDHVGLSNFSIELLGEARDILDAPVFVHQVETHPLLQQDELRDYANEHGMHHVAFSPLQSGGVFDVPELTAIAEKHGVSEAQMSLAWLRSKPGVHPISKSTAHLRANLEALDLELDDEDADRIDAIDREERGTDRDNAPWNE